MTPPSPQPPPSSEDDALSLPAGVRVPWSVVRFQFARSSGPGGQNVNKVSTKAELWVPVTCIVGLTERAALRLRVSAGQKLTRQDEIHIACDEHRSQLANKQEALDRLREMILTAMHEPKKRRKTKPSKGAMQRRLNAKKIRGATKALRRGGAE